jgi:hypothetical protein
MRLQPLPVIVAISAVLALTVFASAQEMGPLVIAKQGYFFVGGKYFDTPSGKIMAGHSYVEYQFPAKRTHRFPLVMIAGGAMSGANFTGTPDGRDGWAQYFLARGYAVYLVDQVGRGRSPYVEAVYGKSNLNTSKFLMERFVAVARYALWPQARLHTQWPGTGEPGDRSTIRCRRRSFRISPTRLFGSNSTAMPVWLCSTRSGPPCSLPTHSQAPMVGRSSMRALPWSKL